MLSPLGHFLCHTAPDCFSAALASAGFVPNFVLKRCHFSAYWGRMMTFFLMIFTIALVLVSLAAIFLVLMQRPSENAGFGSSLGGSTVESIFGGDAGSVLLKATIKCMVLFFVLAMGISMLYIHRANAGAHPLSDQLPPLQAVSAGATTSEEAMPMAE